MSIRGIQRLEPIIGGLLHIPFRLHEIAHPLGGIVIGELLQCPHQELLSLDGIPLLQGFTTKADQQVGLHLSFGIKQDGLGLCNIHFRTIQLSMLDMRPNQFVQACSHSGVTVHLCGKCQGSLMTDKHQFMTVRCFV